MNRSASPTAPAPLEVDYSALGAAFEESIAPYEPAWTPELRRFDAEVASAYSFARRLIELRTSLGLTQTQSAAIVGEHQSEISRMERGRFTPSFSRGSRILAALESHRAGQPIIIIPGPIYRARVIARYFLTVQDDEDPITSLKLQKLLYFAKGTFFALRDQQLFREPMLAWDHGPVVDSVWREFAANGRERLPKPEGLDVDGIDPATRALLDYVYDRWGRYSAWKLREMTHQEGPWKATPRNDRIDDEAVRSYFKSLFPATATNHQPV
jgi:uncharacterized phage-associated protein/DNA-binding XRE family transcriptional regulator